MAQVEVTINGRSYTIACDDGQESHLTKLAAYLDSRVAELAGATGQLGDARMLVMTGLLLADELSEAQAARPEEAEAGTSVDDAETASAIESLAIRLEAIADKLSDA